MRSYNRIFLIGNCAAEPILGSSKENVKYLYFPLAVNKSNSKENSEADFHRITIWGEISENLSDMIKKGSRVFVTGKLTNHKYETNDQVRYITEVKADQIEVLDLATKE